MSAALSYSCPLCKVSTLTEESLRRHLEDDHWHVPEPQVNEEADAVTEQGGMA